MSKKLFFHPTTIFILLIAAAVLFWSKDFSYPSQPYFDEVYYVPAINEYLKGNIEAYDFHYQKQPGLPYDWTHPPLGRLLGVIGVAGFGNNSFGWRITGLVLGLSSLVVFYLLAKKLFPGSKVVPLASLFLFIFDLLPLVHARAMMLDIYLLFFALLSVLMLLSYLNKSNWIKLALLGLLMGCTIATKWNGVFVVGLVFSLIFVRRLKEKRFYLPHYLAEIGVLTLTAVGVYLASYSQYFWLGGSIGNWLNLQKQMWQYHAGLKAMHTYQADWWGWPLMLRPTWYFVERFPTEARNIYALGNPIIWWTGLVSLPFLGVSWVVKRNFAWGLILLGYLSAWLPWSLSPRIGFLHYYLFSLPFLYLSLGWALSWLLARLGKWGRGIVLVYLLAVLTSFLYFYPITTGERLTYKQLEERFWFSSWK
ncbi:MAG: hypothetical protein A3F33_00125 [Candidatus Woykebacteria bacterium RIFCSPHIGHO2_12_FULL_43_10]|uniref:Polyprenol-phosphate-mannose--protein mannosyltransferase n=1 Tax=Candidatus Woykebacteria bacterium RIFCSPHIGHO2_02_FULL_43_16b TaxID=1802601 RepID=A0A1G1WPR6_9BACT|nr:MAG: hypothetical protein A2802_01755 [Candidatus Woykebacteria bacterium RIFCSPHIGHO2_01_FULL_43_29]OGY29689.1 MAG: hypothetical protein A3J50_04485 [Candidatus Woykebacteria bacterium RIFCSPHIGHO2_02_FULL_43_16b]OGY30401.1 MAG: hypothetical protein A3F33_00125 [Candidatus Woykebacteria bacterium RIFCSPHIGHO2_12_FULL_43_10]